MWGLGLGQAVGIKKGFYFFRRQGSCGPRLKTSKGKDQMRQL
jgi:hypothetical protein